MDDPFFSAIGGFGSSLLNGFFNQRSQQQQQAWNEKMYQRQYQDNINLWNMQNEYNLPSAELARKIDAGINPLFDPSSSSSGPIQGAQPMAYERASAPSFSNPVSDFLEAKLRNAQIANIQADSALKSNQTLSEEQRRENLIKERDQMEANITKLLADASYTDKQREQLQKFLEYADDIYQSQIDINESTKDLNNEQKRKIRELLPGEKELQSYTMENFRQQWNKWSAEITHLAAEDAVLEKQAKYYLISLLNNGFAGSGFSINNALISALIDNDMELDSDLRDTIEGIFNGKSNRKNTFNKVGRNSSGQWSSSFSSNSLVPE